MGPTRQRRAVILAAGLLAACSVGEAERKFFDDCGEALGQSEGCFIERRAPDSSDIALATEIADRWIDVHPPEQQVWDWGEGVLMFSLTELYRVTGHLRYLDYTQSWLDVHIEGGYDIYWSDSCPPALTAMVLYEETGDEAYLQIVEDVFQYLDHEAPRTPEGGLSHLGDFPGLDPPTLWLDSLFMYGMVMSRWGERTDDPARLDQFTEQLEIFASLMQDDSGLMLHAVNWPGSTELDTFWARGNGWVVASGFDALRVRQLRGELDEAEGPSAILLSQVDAVIDTQDEESGLWWTVLNRPGEIYLETSASALFAFGMARGFRYGVLEEEVLSVLSQARSGLLSRIRRDEEGRPVVTGISGPTTAGDFEDYERVELEEDESFGVGAAILALIELSGLPL